MMSCCATLIDAKICVCLCFCLVITFYQTKDATPALAMLLPLFVLPANPAFWPKRDAEVSKSISEYIWYNIQKEKARYQRIYILYANIYCVIHNQYICPLSQGRAEPSSGEPCLTWEVVEKKMAWGVVILIGEDVDDNNDHLYTFGSFRWWLRSKCWCRCLWSDDSNWETGSRLHITYHDDKQRNVCLYDNPKWKNNTIAACC